MIKAETLALGKRGFATWLTVQWKLLSVFKNHQPFFLPNANKFLNKILLQDTSHILDGLY
ncbi:hypothetical protein HMPREF0061_0951 [Aerococcus viridans ATCC 11563 = CCUG 4311]|uniref:Uncharacterized protein n=1 Tax=Aerococcus viridans (strain ATCC 11563 / DSM 20340 / CCUG 4311 / JCM 20461 / NBRC 12219 / NCTC 8251 / M1) TaxID=655812 RepID=A0ABN0A8Z4_AERVM|nr:hypothetical protein HMPREF0061_0951 [Aerococcus viridans ATCC 11563 = CCUG 4311]